MSLSRSRLLDLTSALVVLTLLAACGVATLVIYLAGDWQNHARGLTLTLKIMWGSWLVLFAAVVLTRITILGWRYRTMPPGALPAALAKAMAAGVQPSLMFRAAATSFTITVVMVALLGAAILASVLIWILGDWRAYAGSLGLVLKIIWGSWWVLCIIAVLVRVAIFYRHRQEAQQARLAGIAEQAPGTDGRNETTSTERTTGNAP